MPAPVVIFIGAGPGSADLITLRGARHLASARVVLFDALTDPALRETAPNALWIDVGKRGFDYAELQSRINGLLVEHAREGGPVVRLKGGDPSVFGRLEEEMAALAAAGIGYEVVPGVTAALAAAAQAGRPAPHTPLQRPQCQPDHCHDAPGHLARHPHCRHRGVLHGWKAAGRLGRPPAKSRLAGQHAGVGALARGLAGRPPE
jgi:siroheme synthase